MKTRALHIMMLLVAISAAGCDLFGTRDPEPPQGGGSTFVPPTSPDLVLTNMAHAISEKNVVNYMRCFVDTLNSSNSYSFVPTAAASAQYAATFSSWTLQSERSYFSGLAASTPASATPVLILSGGFSVVTSDSAVYAGDYQLTFQHGISGVPETVRGNVQFIIAIDRNSFWGLTRWIDNPIGSEPPWSDLKGRFSN
jgi:hypothetical protein